MSSTEEFLRKELAEARRELSILQASSGRIKEEQRNFASERIKYEKEIQELKKELDLIRVLSDFLDEDKLQAQAEKLCGATAGYTHEIGVKCYKEGYKKALADHHWIRADGIQLMRKLRHSSNGLHYNIRIRYDEFLTEINKRWKTNE